jgi:hypothetical protein
VATDHGKIDSDYWTNSVRWFPLEGDIDEPKDAPQTVPTNNKTTSILYYDSLGSEEDPALAYTDAQPFVSNSEETSNTKQALLGHWGGIYTFHDSEAKVDLVSHIITFHDAQRGTFEGNGTRARGDFHIAGQISGEEVTFTERHLRPVNRNALMLSFHGRFHDNGQEINGEWGSLKSKDDATEGSPKGAITYLSEGGRPVTQGAMDVIMMKDRLQMKVLSR